MAAAQRIIIMGVSGCGKSVVGRALADSLGFRFIDADDYHSPENVAKMSKGIPLTDADRSVWLDTLTGLLAADDRIVMACSALKANYRRRLSEITGPAPVFIHLHGSFDAIHDRLKAREGHFFTGRKMLESQFDALEPPDPAEAIQVWVDDVSVEEVLERCATALRRHASPA
ncbi:MAG: gluconokinase [Paracoccus sp. (in: a-proteobacteria)]|nr:gluconokinase [Paracoccus sp. (in: a-proteobacteria)]